jgi:3D (Asp-Asp-Asp) domain-containing protein
LKVKSILQGSAIVSVALLSFSLVLSASTLSAETLPSKTQQSATKQSQAAPSAEATAPVVRDTALGSVSNEVAAVPVVEEEVVAPATHYLATAYSLRGRTASGRLVSKGLIAADPRVLPLGSRVRLDAGTYSGEYLVADTGTKVRGRRIDIWTPSSREAIRFGKRTIKLTILSLGGKKRATNPVKE